MKTKSKVLILLISILSISIILTITLLIFKSSNSPKTSYKSHTSNTITTQCDIITNYDNTVVIEYKGNSYKCYVKDGNIYDNLTKCTITFQTTDNLENYKIIDIKPL